jgi:hypothetical protein
MRRGEEHSGVVCQQCLLRSLVLDAGAQDRAVRGRVAERLEIGLSQRPLPHEQLVLDLPLAETARQHLRRLR